MNIRAVMAALELDLDRSMKQALILLACRADRYTAMANVSVRRVAADMAVSYKTALAALNALVDAGYLTVDKSPGEASLWMLTSVVVTHPPMTSTTRTSDTITEGVCNGVTHKESLEKDKGGGAARVPHGAAVDSRRLVVVKPNGADQPDWTAHMPNWTKQRLRGERQE